jgi:hypothetical protein
VIFGDCDRFRPAFVIGELQVAGMVGGNEVRGCLLKQPPSASYVTRIGSPGSFRPGRLSGSSETRRHGSSRSAGAKNPSAARRSLRWQRLKPFEQFAELIERHWEGITAYCQPENKVALGFVEGLNKQDPRHSTTLLRPAR